MQETNEFLVTPDFTQTQDPVEPGIYNCRIMSSELGSWEGKEGKPSTKYINWRMETFGEAEEKNNGRSIFNRTPIEGKGAFRLQNFFRAAMGEDCKGAFDRSMLYGREVQVTVTQQKDNPQYTEVSAVKPIQHS